jgi:sec-independent protein translocase protein TatA
MFSSFGYTEMLLFGVIALMLFGSRLPDVARNFGRTYRELRKKVDDFQREFRDWDKVDNAPRKTLPSYNADDDVKRSEPAAPKFTPPPEDDD